MIAAVLIALLTPVTVLLGLAGTVIVVPLTVNVLAAVSDVGASVPCTVVQAVCQSAPPTSTQVL